LDVEVFMRRTRLLCMVTAMLLLPSFALADSISPLSDTATITLGDTYTIKKTVTVDGRLASDPIDVVFLFDTTNGFQGFFQDWTSGRDIPTDLVNLATSKGSNVKVGVATYEDFPTFPWGAATDVPYARLADLGTGAAAITAMNAITTGSGDDLEEANLHALGKLTETVDGMSWTTGATRVVVWMGDEPGHPSFEDDGVGGTYPGDYDTPSAIAALLGADIVVEALDFEGTRGLNGNVDDYVPTVIDSNQANKITAGTGGDYWTGFWSSDPTRFDDFLDTVDDALNAAIFEYLVSLDTSLVPSGLGLTGAGATFTGVREDDGLGNPLAKTYMWNLQYTPTKVGDYSFGIAGLVDGLVVGVEEDTYTVVRGTGPQPEIPEPSTVALLGLGLLGAGIVARRRKK
jgi:hypothetical protein